MRERGSPPTSRNHHEDCCAAHCRKKTVSKMGRSREQAAIQPTVREPGDRRSVRYAETSEIDRVIVEMISRGATNSEIAERLHYSLPAVKLGVRRLMRNFGARNRVELAAKATRLDIVVEELSAEGFTDAEMLFLSQFSELPPETRAIIAEVGSALSRTLSRKIEQ